MPFHFRVFFYLSGEAEKIYNKPPPPQKRRWGLNRLSIARDFFFTSESNDFWIVLYITYYLWMEPTPLLSTERLPTHQPALL
jgi:hypothetical protein